MCVNASNTLNPDCGHQLSVSDLAPYTADKTSEQPVGPRQPHLRPVSVLLQARGIVTSRMPNTVICEIL